MGSARDVLHKKLITVTSLDKSPRQDQVETLPNRYSISTSEKILVDLIRKYGEISISDLITFTDYSRTKTTGYIDSLLEKNIVIINHDPEYSGGRRSKKYSLNGDFGLAAA